MAIYRCLSPLLDLHIELVNKDVEKLLVENGHHSLCILTAYNPESGVQSKVDNQQSQDQLVSEIERQGFYWLEGVNLDVDEIFPDESTCWVMGMTSAEGYQVSKQWAQNAFVFYRIGEKPELIWVKSKVK